MPNPFDQFQDYRPPAMLEGGQGATPGTEMSGFGNPNLKGEEYLSQFSPEIQQAVKDYVHGLSKPTGNPRRLNYVKLLAGKYGADIGMPADDTNFMARQRMRNELSSGGPSTLGGQFRNGVTAMEHLANYAENAVNLHNSGGLGIAPIAHLVNNLRGLSTEQAGKINALNTNAGHYGQEITKFYAGSPGGQAERERFEKSAGGAQSPAELAGLLRTELNLIPAKMHQIVDEIGSTLGGNLDAKTQKKLADMESYRARIERALSQLEGGRSIAPIGDATGAPPGLQNAPAAAAGSPAGYPEGTVIRNPQTGQRLMMRGGQWSPM